MRPAPAHPHRSWIVDVAAWIILVHTALWLAGMVLVVVLTADRLGSAAAGALALLAAWMVPVAMWSTWLGVGLRQRRPRRRRYTLGTMAVFTLYLAIRGSASWLSSTEVASLVGNLTTIALLLLPPARRDLWWSAMAASRPDYVALRYPDLQGPPDGGNP